MRSATWWITARSPTPSRSIPQTLAAKPFAGILTTPGRFTNISPRVDYQLGANHTLMFRYGITHSDVRDNGIGGFDLISRGYHSQFTNQTVQAADTALIGSFVNETRFQFYRSATQAIANSLSPAILVLQSFNGGGTALGRTFDAQNSYELQNYGSMLKGRHSWRFGVRLRGQTDDSVSPQNFNGTFTFGGGALAPVLDAQNRPVPGANGQPQLAPVTSIERYRRTLLFQQLGDTPHDDPRARRRRHAVHDQYRRGGTGGAPDGRGHLRGRRVARAAESHAQPRPPLRDTDEYPRLARSCSPCRVCLGARRRRAEAPENRPARRLRHLL